MKQELEEQLKNKEEQGGGATTDLHQANLGIYKGL